MFSSENQNNMKKTNNNNSNCEFHDYVWTIKSFS